MQSFLPGLGSSIVTSSKCNWPYDISWMPKYRPINDFWHFKVKVNNSEDLIFPQSSFLSDKGWAKRLLINSSPTRISRSSRSCKKSLKSDFHAQRARKFKKTSSNQINNKKILLKLHFWQFSQFKNWFLVVFEIAKNGIWSKKLFVKLIYLISRVFAPELF